MDDANASFGRGGLINVSKFEKLHGMVSDLLSFQQNTYQDVEYNEQLSTFLVELPHNSEGEHVFGLFVCLLCFVLTQFQTICSSCRF